MQDQEYIVGFLKIPALIRFTAALQLVVGLIRDGHSDKPSRQRRNGWQRYVPVHYGGLVILWQRNVLAPSCRIAAFVVPCAPFAP